jgi:hypothetical protein
MNRRQSAVPYLLLATGYLLLVLAVVSVRGSSASDYPSRVQEAVAIIQSATPAERASAVNRVASLLPQTEDIVFRDQRLTVNNRWLHEEADRFLGELDDAAKEKTYLRLQARLNALLQQIQQAEQFNVTGDASARERLKAILSRSEFVKARQESWLQRAKRWVLERLAGLLELLPGVKRLEGPWLWLLGSLVWAAAFGVLYVLVRRLLRPKAEPVPSSAQRVVLGTVIEDHVTPDDLRREARELAQQRDYRGAIRKFYIALLFDFEQRGWLELKAAATNNDYLRRLQTVPTVYPVARYLTRRFEYFWYGKVVPAQSEFEEFMGHYEDTRRKTQSVMCDV